jgi:hypothetical protein
MKNNLLHNVNENILKQIIYISENYKPVYFCGSISLNALGIINRPVNDIDMCVHISESGSAKNYFQSLEKNKNKIWLFKNNKANHSEYNGHKRYIINDIEHCLFFNNDKYCIEVEIKQGLRIKISLPQETIAAKRQYIKDTDDGYGINDSNLRKHKEDVEFYEKIEKTILRQIKIKTLSEEFRLVSTTTDVYIDDTSMI